MSESGISVFSYLKNLKYYLANLILIWGAIAVYRFSGYYSNYLRTDTQAVLLSLAFVYTSFGLLYYFATPPGKLQRNKGLIVFSGLLKLLNFSAAPANPWKRLEKIEKVTIMFLVVKFFFLPIMLNFMFSNFFAMRHNYSRIAEAGSLLSMDAFNSYYYPMLIAGIFLIDTAYFSFGYAFEARFLKNKIRTVEPTFIGWFVVMLSYPPFNSQTNNYINWYANDMVLFSTETLTFITRVTIIVLFLVYLSATIALGTKCSNLTNRGIVSRGPYAVIRHPAYICKNSAWWLMIIPIGSLAAIASMATWSFIYFLRAITEERHLGKDPDYVAYKQKVKYRFIPYVF